MQMAQKHEERGLNKSRSSLSLTLINHRVKNINISLDKLYYQIVEANLKYINTRQQPLCCVNTFSVEKFKFITKPRLLWRLGQTVYLWSTVCLTRYGFLLLIIAGKLTASLKEQALIIARKLTANLKGQTLIIARKLTADFKGQTLIISGKLTYNLKGQAIIISGTLTANLNGQAMIISGKLTYNLKGQGTKIYRQIAWNDGRCSD